MRTSTTGPAAFVLASSGSCLYHCDRPTRPHEFRTPGGTLGWVYTCPGGTVSTVVFLGSNGAPAPARIRRYLQARLRGPERVKPRDLRAATRHGAELGSVAERWVGGPGAGTPIHLLYWRRYPRKAGRRYEYLYACWEHGTGEVRFYPAPGSRIRPACPFCAE